MNYEEYIKAEKKAEKKLASLAKQIAANCGAVAHYGDGNCGYVINKVIDALRDAGLYRDPVPVKPKKKTIPRSLAKVVFERDEYRCVTCGSHIDLSVDHIHPESKGGDLELSNLQTLCRPCNSRKGASV